MDEVEDTFRWNWETSNSYSARSAYLAFFEGKTALGGAKQVWGSRAPAKCKFFLWLALRGRCWTADQLGRRGLQRPAACPFCDQHEETIDHPLLVCVLARKVWTIVFRRWGLEPWIPNLDGRLAEWLPARLVDHSSDRDLWTAITLVCWCLSTHRNGVVFDGVSPSPGTVIDNIVTEAERWSVARVFRGSLAPVDRWRFSE